MLLHPPCTSPSVGGGGLERGPALTPVPSGYFLEVRLQAAKPNFDRLFLFCCTVQKLLELGCAGGGGEGVRNGVFHVGGFVFSKSASGSYAMVLPTTRFRGPSGPSYAQNCIRTPPPAHLLSALSLEKGAHPRPHVG